MALSGPDETDLILPLLDAGRGRDALVTFLRRVLRRTGADLASIHLREDLARSAPMRTIAAGARAELTGLETAPPPEAIAGFPFDALRPGRVYSFAEVVAHDPVLSREHAGAMAGRGIVDERVVRLSGLDDAQAWLVLASSRPCTAADGALLSSLAPFLAAALRTFLKEERRESEASLARAGLERSRTGWIVFDRDSRVLDASPRARALTGAVTGERLRELPGETALAIAALAGGAPLGSGESVPVTLQAQPRIEALLHRHDLPSGPAAMAVFRLPHPPGPEAARRFARLFSLPAREAEFALALGSGRSIAEAASDLGLTLETARNYSKRLYAKLGLRGQADLVRTVCESAATLA